MSGPQMPFQNQGQMAGGPGYGPPGNPGFSPRPSQPLPGGPPRFTGPLPGNQQPGQHQAAKRNLLQRAKARYQRLSRRSKTLLIVLSICLLLPTLLTIVEGINALVLYSRVQSGVSHLTNVKNIFGEKDASGNSSIFDVAKLQRAQPEVDAAYNDFTQIRDTLHNDAMIGLLGGIFPAQLETLRNLSSIGVDAMEIAQEGMKAAIRVAPKVPDPTLKDQTKPMLNTAMMDEMRTLIDFAMPKIKDMAQNAQGIAPDSLPVSDSQRQTLSKVVALIPNVVTDLEMVQDGLKTKALDWLIGADKQRNFLVQTLDRGELRSTGGFTGQFGVMPLNGGRMGKLDLQNVGVYEENLEDQGIPRDSVFKYIISHDQLPEQYSWWPIPNFGLRDSNVSADFPSSAKLAMNLFNTLYTTNHPDKFKQPVDGLISFSPFLIAELLRVIGPLTIDKYNETVTADNLEEKLHYYQLDNKGIEKSQFIENLPAAEARKMFTKRVSEKLMDSVKTLSADKIVNLVPTMLSAMKTRDLQVYFDNQATEDWIAKYGSAASIDPLNGQDGVYIVQANISVSKAQQYVRTYVKDQVTLDASGGATHVMTMRLAYTQIGSVYGLDTYLDYMRIYVPENSQFLWGKGFAQLAEQQCGWDPDAHANTIPCQTDIFGDGTQICPPNSDTYLAPAYRGTPDGTYGYFGLNKIGEPTNMQSDVAGRKMFGGWVEVMKNCNMTFSLSWYVPDVAKDKPYNLLFQRQAGTLPIVDLTVLPTPGDCAQLKTSGTHFSGVLSREDKLLTAPTGQTTGGQEGCYPKMKM
jgi:hypothetical protein